MPKSNQSCSPPLSHAKPASDESTQRLSDVALRKKKNADAQAAFRARRANYIATLEETVTSLESVVLQLQDSCREARSETAELRQENARLRHGIREKDRYWKAFCQSRKTGHAQRAENDDLSAIQPPFSPVHSHAGGMGTTHLESSHIAHYAGDGLYRNDEQSATLCNGPYAPGHAYPNHSPSMPYVGPDHSKYGQYHQYQIQSSNRDSPWTTPMTQTASSSGESGPPTSTNSSTHSPGFTESPTLTASEMSYVGRYPAEDQKVPLSSLDSAPYVFPSSRSLSPISSTPPSSSSTSLASSFQFTFPETSSAHDRTEFDYRRTSHGPEVTLHGGTADVSLATSPACDAVRYRLGARRATSGPERLILPVLPPLSGSDNTPQHDRGSTDSESGAYPPYARLRPRRATVPSRSPSPAATCPPISGTLAVIKAQAFGALRRTRARTKRTSEGNARVAMDVLEARGIGMGINVPTGSKRPRLHDDEGEMET